MSTCRIPDFRFFIQDPKPGAVIARSVERYESDVAISCEALTAEPFAVKASLAQFS